MTAAAKIIEPQLFSFDFWGTIVSPNPEFGRARNALVYEALRCREQGILEPAFTADFRHIKQGTEALSEVQGRHIGLNERLDILCRHLDIALPSDLVIENIRDGQRALSREFPAALFSEGIGPLFRDITGAGKAIGLVSNTGMLDGQDVGRLLDLHGISRYIEYKVFSDETGVAKPNPEVFCILANQAGVPPEYVVHTGDNERADYAGSLAIGMSAIHGSLDSVGIGKVRAYLS